MAHSPLLCGGVRVVIVGGGARRAAPTEEPHDKRGTAPGVRRPASDTMSRRAVLFARVSTDDRGQDTESQLIALRTVGPAGATTAHRVPMERPGRWAAPDG